MNIAMTPDQFQTSAQAWITAGVAILGALGGLTTAILLALPKLTQLLISVKAALIEIENVKGRQDRQSSELTAQQVQINAVAIATPTAPAVQPQPTNQIKTP